MPVFRKFLTFRKIFMPKKHVGFSGFLLFSKTKEKNLKENDRVIAKMYPFVHFPSPYTRPMHGNPSRGLACTSTQICYATNLCLYINYKPTIRCRDLPIKIQFQTRWPHPDIYVSKETRLAPPEYETFSQWRDVTSRGCQTMSIRLHFCHRIPTIMHTAHGGTDLGARASKASARHRHA